MRFAMSEQATCLIPVGQLKQKRREVVTTPRLEKVESGEPTRSYCSRQVMRALFKS